MDKKKVVDKFIEDFLQELEEKNVAVFAGAGLSVSTGMVDWKGLLKEFAEDLGLDIERETDLISLAQYSVNENPANRHKLNMKIFNEYHLYGKVPTENHKILARLPISTYWTTNYDKLIEKALNDNGKIVDIKHTTKQLQLTRYKRDAVLYKMHGDSDEPTETVLFKDDYESYHIKRNLFLNALSGDLVSKLFVFIGFSFTDPNLDYVLSRIRVVFDKNQRGHYCFFKKVSRLKDESDDDLKYREIKQSLVINDLKRFNITTILVDEYNGITKILKEIENRYKQKTVFISGSAHEYGKWDKDIADNFIKSLSSKLLKNKNRIVSGFGLGVGSSVISGVLEEVYLNKNENLKDELLLRPFPQGGKNPEQWQRYREDMIRYAGIAIFIFGNKIVDGKVVEANGVRSEYEIAKDQSLLLIPVGATGYMAKMLWEELMKNFDNLYKDYPELKSDFQELNNKSLEPEQLINIIINIIKKLNS